EGIDVHYEDLEEGVGNLVGKKENTLVVVTPAVPKELGEWKFFEQAGYTILKRAQILGKITEEWKTLAVAGTHGKTTTSTLLAHVLSSTEVKCNAFLGGISSNFNSNLLFEPLSPWMVVEADEYDRSFHQLKPFSSIVTSTDADHLDIYQNEATMQQAFEEYVQLIDEQGSLIVHHSVQVGKNLARITYGLGDNLNIDYRGFNLRMEESRFMMDLQTPTALHKNIALGLPGIHNAENAVAVIAMCESIGVPVDEIRNALANFKGVKRRFEYIIQKEDLIYIDDYAHHPTAINSLVDSVRMIYKDKPIHLIFQPHLYSRTQDFMSEFARSLSGVDETILMPIYPAREEPIEGITSEALADRITTKVCVKTPEEVLDYVKHFEKGVLLTVGAGNIDRLVEPIRKLLR
ncbi:MAG TPA: cyanophycin synthetase, partial [Brumimicrobium sp.]|nr:cyanophycin synthetase [Brumimicrobium sp.]